MARKWIRTGIDLGSGRVKLVRAEGRARLERITHAGDEEWDAGEADAISRAAGALGRLLSRLRLSRGSLGRIAVSVWDEQIGLRDVVVASLSEEELRRALPYEARRHLFMENMASPVLDCQVLGYAAAEEPGAHAESEGPGPTAAAVATATPGSHSSQSHGAHNATSRMRVLMTAVPQSVRDFPLLVLGRLGLEPEVVDLEPLSGFNALLVQRPGGRPQDQAFGLCDLGGRQAFLHLAHSGGGLYSRAVGPGAPFAPELVEPYVSTLAGRVGETILYYRGRQRLEVGQLFLCGGGALLPDISDQLARAVERPVSVFHSFLGLQTASRVQKQIGSRDPLFAVATGLCRWWDGPDV